MAFIHYHFQSSDSDEQEVLIAILTGLGFDSFEEKSESVEAYIEEGLEKMADVSSVLKSIDYLQHIPFNRSVMEVRNWNEIWESSFNPIQINRLIGVRASFHEPLNTDIEIVIDPKMSFGTGHHATTFMMLDQMLQLDFKNKKVLDYGCGTSILAIAAEKMGAASVLAIDNDPLCIENSEECLQLNHCRNVRLRLGDIESVNEESFDFILANINRNTILRQFPVMNALCAIPSKMLMSGFLVSDEPMMQEMAEKLNWKVIQNSRRDNWLCLRLEKNKE